MLAGADRRAEGGGSPRVAPIRIDARAILAEETRAMNAKVLLVDDDPAVLAFLAAALERFRFEVTAVESAEAGLECLGCQGFDLVITDFRLPRLAGDAVVKAVRALRREIPVIVITGLLDELPMWLRSGPEAVRVVAKPIPLGLLQREVAAALRLPAAGPG